MAGPIAFKIANQIEEHIKAGIIKPGQALQNTSQLSRTWNIAYATAQKVYIILANRGLISFENAKAVVL